MEMTGRAIIWCGYIRRNKKLEPVAFRHDIEIAHRAVLRRGVAPHDVRMLVCDDTLLPEDFAGERFSPDLHGLERVMRDIAAVATPRDGLLFIATNHGEHDGLLTAVEPPDEFDDDDPDSAYVAPAVLGAHLDAIPGQQVVLIATCHAGVFLELGNERRLVLASCGDERDYTNDQLHPPRSEFLYEVMSNWASVSLANYKAPSACPLRDAFKLASESCPRGGCEGHASWPFEVSEHSAR